MTVANLTCLFCTRLFNKQNRSAEGKQTVNNSNN